VKDHKNKERGLYCEIYFVSALLLELNLQNMKTYINPVGSILNAVYYGSRRAIHAASTDLSRSTEISMYNPF
jgi:hypothetical protein